MGQKKEGHEARCVDSDWAQDLLRYDMQRPFLKEQSLWAIGLYRLGRRLDTMPDTWRKRILSALYWPSFRLIETITGISLPKSVVIGPGLRIWHFGGIFIHPDVVIGRHCTLRQGVTIGNRQIDGPVPVIGDHVEFGACAQVLGGIRIGNGCRIGAMALVLTDMPDGSTAVGVPARILGGASSESGAAVATEY